MRKANQKRELAYIQGQLMGVTYVCDAIDKQLCESNSYAENIQLWRVRDYARNLQSNLRKKCIETEEAFRQC